MLLTQPAEPLIAKAKFASRSVPTEPAQVRCTQRLRGGPDRMALDPRDMEKLIRILRLLGSDQPGERASAGLAAHRLVQSLDTDWETLLAQPEARVLVQRVRDWDLDQRSAAESRIRQLKAETERQERQLKALRTRVNTLTERERLRREMSETDPD